MQRGAAGYPADFGLALDRATQRPSAATLIGGSPVRLLRLSGRGSALLDAWLAGGEVGPDREPQLLARRLVDAGIARPRPPRSAGPRRDEVTVVVPVRDRASGLAATLAALDGLHVIVVDDGSVDAVSSRVAEVIRREVPGGPAAARNTGWRSVTREIVVFLDADCVPEEGWLETLLPHFADATVAGVAPRIRSAGGAGTLARYEKVMSPLDMGRDAASVLPGTRVPYVPSACLAVRRSALETVGGFDERLRFGEDVDLVWRLVRAGCVVRYEPRAVVHHPPRPDVRSMVRQRFDYGRSAAALAARHGGDVAPLSVSPACGAVWALATSGRAVPAITSSVVAAALAASRAGGDPVTRRALALLAIKGDVSAARWIAMAVRRAWTPVVVAIACLAPRRLRRRAVTLLALSFAWPLADWMVRAGGDEHPWMGVAPWLALRWLDDLSYQSGTWAGVLERRSVRALLPRLTVGARTGRQAAARTSSSVRPVSR